MQQRAQRAADDRRLGPVGWRGGSDVAHAPLSCALSRPPVTRGGADGSRGAVSTVRGSIAARAGRRATDVLSGRMQEAARATHLPGHVAIIMDGNGRWAAARGGGAQRRASPGRRGGPPRRARRARARHPGLTLYAFSAQNWERPAAEVADLMRLLRRFVLEERAELAGARHPPDDDRRRGAPAGVRARAAGRR